MMRRNCNEYRRVWIKHHGPVPREPDGTSYEIHHIDGDHTNNAIENLIAVTIQEHFDIHYKQEDWGACALIARNMNKTAEERSELSRLAAMKRVEHGTHHFVGDTNPVFKQIEDGTHNFIGESNPVYKQIEEGTHVLTGGKIQRATCLRRMAEGTHNIGEINSYTSLCPHCGRTIKGKSNEKRHQESCLRKFTDLIQNS